MLLKSILESEQFQDAMKFATQPKARPRIILLRFRISHISMGLLCARGLSLFLFYMSCTHYKVFHSGIFLGDASQFFFLLWTTSHYIATQTCLHCCLIDIAPAYSHFCDLVKLAFLQENYFSLYSIHNTSFYEMQFFVCIILLRVNRTDKMQHSLLKYLCHTYF